MISVKNIRRSSSTGPDKRRGHDGEQGFTLVEMLVVITIIGLIMGLIGPRVLNYLSESKVKAAKIQLQSFAGALDLFYLDAGRFPRQAAACAAPSAAGCWPRTRRRTACRRGARDPRLPPMLPDFR